MEVILQPREDSNRKAGAAMKRVKDDSEQELKQIRKCLLEDFEEVKGRGLSINMSRGKPASAQLDHNMGLLQFPQSYILENGADARNYGMLEGIPECRRLFGELLGLDPEQILMGGSSSLNLMFDIVAFHCLMGTEGEPPWSYRKYEGKAVKFLCPVPGYDRHFKICEKLGIEMISIPLREDGPDMDLVERLVREDDSIKGMWCVPLHSNPQGVCYSDQTVERLAAMETAAPDFRIFWDNAYGVHHIYERVQLKDLLAACKEKGHENRAYYFFSTSKITFPGGGVSLISSSPENIKQLKSYMAVQTLGHDKLNQLRHVQYFQSPEGFRKHMEELAGLLRPKFDLVLERLERELSGTGFGTWSHPKGGYFISFDTMPGCAKRTVQLAKEAGVALTAAGSTYPYGRDPEDRNIRIAPTYLSLEELEQAIDIFILCVKLAGVEKSLEKPGKNDIPV